MICAACDQANAERKQEITKEEKARRSAKLAVIWKKRCPSHYLGSTASKMPIELQVHRREKWNPDHGRGLVITGRSGLGKTSAAMVFAGTSHFSGRITRYLHASDIRQESIKASTSDDSLKRWRNRTLSGVEMIVIDDLGNTANTPTSDEHLLRLLEAMDARRIRKIVTTQFTGQQLISRYNSLESGQAILRRICENADIIKITENPNL